MKILGLSQYQIMVTNNAKPGAHEKSLFICPTAKDPGGVYFLPYGMNMNLSPWNLPLATKMGEVVQPTCVVAMGEAPGQYASTYPSSHPYSIVARHSASLNLLFLAGQVSSFKGNKVGCGMGDPGLSEGLWVTGTASDANANNY